jgi:hypothetical protein
MHQFHWRARDRPFVKLVGKNAFKNPLVQLVFLPDCGVDVQFDGFPWSNCIGVPAKWEARFAQILDPRVNNQFPLWPTREEGDWLTVTIVTLILLTVLLQTRLRLCQTASGSANIEVTPLVPKKLRS